MLNALGVHGVRTLSACLVLLGTGTHGFAILLLERLAETLWWLHSPLAPISNGIGTRIEVFTGTIGNNLSGTAPNANTSTTNQGETNSHLTPKILLHGVVDVNGDAVYGGAKTFLI